MPHEVDISFTQINSGMVSKVVHKLMAKCLFNLSLWRRVRGLMWCQCNFVYPELCFAAVVIPERDV